WVVDGVWKRKGVAQWDYVVVQEHADQGSSQPVPFTPAAPCAPGAGPSMTSRGSRVFAMSDGIIECPCDAAAARRLGATAYGGPASAADATRAAPGRGKAAASHADSTSIRQ